MADWADQVAIVTGGSRGIGREIARALAARGARIRINYATRVDSYDPAAMARMRRVKWMGWSTQSAP